MRGACKRASLTTPGTSPPWADPQCTSCCSPKAPYSTRNRASSQPAKPERLLPEAGSASRPSTHYKPIPQEDRTIKGAMKRELGKIDGSRARNYEIYRGENLRGGRERDKP